MCECFESSAFLSGGLPAFVFQLWPRLEPTLLADKVPLASHTVIPHISESYRLANLEICVVGKETRKTSVLDYPPLLYTRLVVLRALRPRRENTPYSTSHANARADGAKMPLDPIVCIMLLTKDLARHFLSQISSADVRYENHARFFASGIN